MKHNKKRISRIVDEMVTYFFSIGATDINVNIKEEETQYKIFVKGNYLEKYKEKLIKLKKCLAYPKQEEMEEYYWELTGECDVDTELTLVGIMTDKVEMKITDDYIEVVLYRSK